jgi:phosphatidylglycerophosphate synthase
MVNKINEEYDNPFDVMLYHIIDSQLDWYHRHNFTPNMITTISLLTALGGVHVFYKDKYVLGGILFLLGYYFDCVDGKLARKYNMVTKFGDHYDHISDFIKVIALIIFGYLKSKSKKKFAIIFVIGLAIILCSMMFFQCQELIYNRNESSSLSFIQKIDLLKVNKYKDPNKRRQKCIEYIHTLKYVGVGGFWLYCSFVMIFWSKII